MSDEDVSVRPANGSDAAEIDAMVRALAVIEGSRTEIVFTLDQLSAALDGDPPRLRAILAEDAQGAVGVVTYTIDFAIWTGGDVLRIDDVFVHERARGRGVGRRLMTRIAALAVGGGMPARWEVEPDNHPAQRFYRGLGVAVRDKMIARWSLDAMRGLVAASPGAPGSR